MSPTDSKIKVSLVIPLYNEREGIAALFQGLDRISTGYPGCEWELVLVNDGSTDDTLLQIERFRTQFSHPIKVISFSRNFGHQPALMAGLTRAGGDAMICMDADLQDPPELIGDFLEKFREGYEIVYAIRKTRTENWLKRIAYAAFYRLFQSMAEIPIPLDAGDFGLMSRRAANLVTGMPERDIFLRGLRSWVGFKGIGIPYDRPARASGTTKYSFSKLLKLAASAFFGFSFLPLRIATSLGLIAVLSATGYTAFALLYKIIYHDAPVGWTSLISIVSFLGGAQLVAIGIVGEYVGRIYKQTQGRPLFIIAEERNI